MAVDCGKTIESANNASQRIAHPNGFANGEGDRWEDGMQMIWRFALGLLVLGAMAGCVSSDPSRRLADGWYVCKRCGSMITSRNGEITFQITTLRAEGCVHKWRESEGADIDPAPDAIP